MGAELSRASSAVGWPAAVAWLVALTCVALGIRRLRKLAALAPPVAQTLLRELQLEAGATEIGVARAPAERRIVADLNERLSDVAFELGLLPATYAASIRLCLASGTALGLLAAIDWARGSAGSAVTVLLCALSGFVGGGAVSITARRAKQRAAMLREGWDRVSREIGKSLHADAG